MATLRTAPSELIGARCSIHSAATRSGRRAVFFYSREQSTRPRGHHARSSQSTQSRRSATNSRIRLLVCGPFRCSEILPKLHDRATRTVAGCPRLNAPSFAQRSGVNDIESELIDEAAHHGFGRWVV